MLIPRAVGNEPNICSTLGAEWDFGTRVSARQGLAFRTKITPVTFRT